MALFLFITIVIILAIAIMNYNQRLKKEARKCSIEAKDFYEKLKTLSSPTHLFTDEELKKLKMEFNPLLETVNQLYDSRFISNEYLDKVGLGEFIEKRKLLNHIQMENNLAFQG